MDLQAEIERRRNKARRASLFKDGKLRTVPYSDWKGRKICGVEILLANKLNQVIKNESDKLEVFEMLDTIFNMTKRMATRLDEYKKGWVDNGTP